MNLSAVRRRAIHAVKNYFRRDWTMQDMLHVDGVSPFIRLHVTHFYFTLMCASASSAVGSCFYPTENTKRLFAAFSACVSFICFYRTAPWKENRRFCLLMLGACFGWAIGTPLFGRFPGVDTGLVATTLLANFVGFACLWVSSKWSSMFEVVYFQGLVLSIPLLLVCVCVASEYFGGYSAEWKFLLYSFLLWYMAYVVAYSQEVVVRARKGDSDHVKHAICLYTDFPAFIIHLITRRWRSL